MNLAARLAAVVLVLGPLTLAAPPAAAADSPERASVRALVDVADKARLKELLASDLDVAHVHHGRADVRLTPAELDDLRARGFDVDVVTPDLYAEAAARDVSRAGGGFLPEYVSYTEAVSRLQSLAAAHPSLTELTTLGQSIEGRDIWALKISDNAGVDENEPEVLLLGNHHAREVISVIIPLAVADSLLSNYGSDPEYTGWVDEREIWIVPVVNPDGLTWVETTDLFWRKNRRDNPGSSEGVDLNRNYEYEWGHDDNGSSGSYGSNVYRGASPASEPEVQAVEAFVNSRDFVVSMSYHSYGNLILWGPGWKPALTVDDDIFTGLGQAIASQNGYAPGNPATGTIYITNGDTDDWMYLGAGHAPVLGLTPEVGTSSDYFNPSASRIPTLVVQGQVCAFEAIRHADRPGRLAPPGPVVPSVPATDDDGAFDVTWSAPTTADTEAVSYEVTEKTGPSIDTDDLESGTGAYETGGWTASSARAFSGTTSLRSGSGNELNRVCLAKEPVVPQFGDSFTFRAWYSIETNWDYAYAILSTDGGRSFEPLPGTNTTMSDPNGTNSDHGITGSSGGWIPMSFDLSPWAGQPVWLGFRYSTDGGVANEGIYVDDVSPVLEWATSTVLAPSVAGTSFAVSGRGDGDWFYSVRGRDAEGEIGYRSRNAGVTVQVTTDVRPASGAAGLALEAAVPNPFSGSTTIRFSLPAAGPWEMAVYDVTGRRVRTLGAGELPAGRHEVVWDGHGEDGRPAVSGVYFCTLQAAGQKLERRAILKR